MYYYKFLKVFYEKTGYKKTIFVIKTYKLTHKFIYLYKLFS
jgi:hypothetical protein